MFFKRFYDTNLAQASYLIGCQRTGEALVVDPNRDVEQYVAAAEAEAPSIDFFSRPATNSRSAASSSNRRRLASSRVSAASRMGRRIALLFSRPRPWR